MPLPPALAARLAKRGLINNQNEPKSAAKIEDHEEVIAEDYDDVNKPESLNFPLQFDCKIRETVPGCPNKYNIYHNCTGYCSYRYGDVPEEPTKSLKRTFSRMLKKYPINESIWEQVYDCGL
ncbi:hypothetical protein RDWZM_006223 [Blomia tropicalis]|uniref:Uncharacterized protein n=1 Tax=Blomia tropicalis TaxID=40697 RepID=A0A9Q0M6P7_BLOTA|nr:hypothetical protein RDWZM_006223 [Blomia tropicalis]